MIWNVHFETMGRAELERFQGERLGELVDRLYRRVPFYRRRMEERGVKPADVNRIADIVKLPFLTKDDMREVYPLQLLAVDLSEIVEVHTSSGTTGTPVVDAYTAKDIGIWAESMARTLAMGDTSRADVVHNAYGYGLFTGGLGVHYGARLIGAAIIPISGGNTTRQLSILRDFKATVLTCTPSYALHLAEAASEQGLDFQGLPLRVGLFGAEPWSESMRLELEAKLRLKALDIYGLTEVIGPGVASECEVQDGLHICEDLFYPEIIDPQTGQVLPDGAKGELVLTTLNKEGTPMLRYRTRDITFLDHAPCRCGRTAVRMHRLLGRTDDMLIIRGVNVFPSQIEEVLLRLEGVEPHYQLIVEREERLDSLEVRVEMNEQLFSDEIKQLERSERRIAEALFAALGIQTRVKLVEPKAIPRSEGKAQRVIDKRKV
jgi:phenylacetate-CoA ligase